MLKQLKPKESHNSTSRSDKQNAAQSASAIQSSRINPYSLSHSDIMQLQSTIGNSAVAELLINMSKDSFNTEQEPTLQMKDSAVNDDPKLEKEADIMGSEALHNTYIDEDSQLKSRPLSHNQLYQRKVIQRVASQITLKSDNTIDQVIVRGRPERVHGDTMGDHTTAFSIQTEGLNLSLQGESITKAVEIIKDLVTSLTDLPGFNFMKIQKQQTGSDGKETGYTATTDIGKKFLEEYKNFSTYISDAESSDNLQYKLSSLQMAIDSYLEVRELIPFSTINLKAKSAGLAGKGKGESKYIAILSTYERCESEEERKEIPDEVLTDAVYKLFDVQSAGMLSAEQDEGMIEKMTAGVSFGDKKDPGERLTLIWQQHTKSIEKMFPESWKRVKNKFDEKSFATKLDEFLVKDFDSFYEFSVRKLEEAKDAYDELTKSQGALNLYHRTKTKLNITKMRQMANIYNFEAEAISSLEELKIICNLIKDKSKKEEKQKLIGKIEDSIAYYKGATKKLDATIETYKADIETELDALKDEIALDPDMDFDSIGGKFDSLGSLNQIRPVKTLESIPAKTPTDTKRETKKIERYSGDYTPASHSIKRKLDSQEAIDSDSLIQSTLPMSIQIIVGKDGKITDMLSEGRPDSPFSGTMGAHTTAWAVHLDRVRNRIKDETANTAAENIKTLLGETEAFGEKRANETKDTCMTPEHEELYSAAKKKMKKFESIDSSKVDIPTLQSMINSVLSFYNLIPGVTRRKINTSGKGEGGLRQILIRYEDKKEFREQTELEGKKVTEDKKVETMDEKGKERVKLALREAMKGLFDGSNADPMRKYHFGFIEQAYPKSYKFSEIASEIPEDTSMEIDKNKEEDEESGDSLIPEKKKKKPNEPEADKK